MSPEAADFFTSLCELTANSKPLISMLTMLATDYIRAAPSIVKVIETYIRQADGDKLPTMYLIDSIVKNVGGDYVALFSNNMPLIFTAVFKDADPRTRSQLHKLRITWEEVFPADKLYQLDLLVHAIDGNWPIPSRPAVSGMLVPGLSSKSIHINPNFVKALPPLNNKTVSDKMREKILKEKKELLVLEKRKVELQLLQTRDVLKKEMKKLESFTLLNKLDDKSIPVNFPPRFREGSPHKRKLEKVDIDTRVQNQETAVGDIKKLRFNNEEPSSVDVKSIIHPANDNINDIAKDSSQSENDKDNSPDEKEIEEPKPSIVSSESSKIEDQSLKEENPPDVCSEKEQSEIIDSTEEPTSDANVIESSLPAETKSNDETEVPADYDVPSDEVMIQNASSEELPNPESIMEVDDPNSNVTESVSACDEEKDEAKDVHSSPKEVIVNPKSPGNQSPKRRSSSSSYSSYPSPESLTSSSFSSNSDKNGSPRRESKKDEKDKELDHDLSHKGVAAMPLLPSSSESGKDVDLRPFLVATSSQPIENTECPTIIENKEEENVMYNLFGNEDVDLRKPVQPDGIRLPSPPPPPFIGEYINSDKTWAKLKSSDVTRPEEKLESKYFSPKNRKDRLGRLSSEIRESKLSEAEMKERAEENYNFIINQAQEQFESGNISFVRYNQMLNEVMAISEEQKLNEAKKEYSSAPDLYDYGEENDSSTEASVSSPQYNFPKHYQSIETNEPDSHYPRNVPWRSQMDKNPNPGYYRFNRGSRWTDRGGRRQFPVNHPTNFGAPPMGPGPGMNQQFPPFPAQRGSIQVRPPNGRGSMPPPRPFFRTFIPPADRNLLNEANIVTNGVITIGQVMRQIRFYGEIGIVLLSWDDPREFCFQPGSKNLIIDGVHKFQLHFGAVSSEISLDGFTSLVHLGRPTRELYVDGKYYSIAFGGPSVEIFICGKVRCVMLEGPPPAVRYGQIKRTDLCAGKVNLILDAKCTLPIFLDGSAQKFDIDGVSCVIKFADNLSTVLINGVPVPISFGGHPVPILFQGKEHFIRLTILPRGIIPGMHNILDMEVYQSQGNVIQSPYPIQPASQAAAPPLPQPSVVPPVQSQDVIQQPLEILASVLSTPVVTPTSSGPVMSYHSEDVPENPSTSTAGEKPVNVGELFKKLLTSGLVSADKIVEAPALKESIFLPEVSFARPETLKTRPNALIAQLYDGIQCSTCGVRFPREGTKKYSNHLDWHFRQNRKEKASAKNPHSRNWYYDLSDLIQLQDTDDLDDIADLKDEESEELKKDSAEDAQEDLPCVPAGDSKNPKCTLCGDLFEEFFNDEKEEWQIKNAVIVEEGIFHPFCLEEFKKKKESPEKEVVIEREEDADNYDPADTTEVIEIDDGDVQEEPIANEESDQVDLTEDEPINEMEDKEKVPLLPEPSKEDDKNDSDDDILQIEVIERKIESYDLLDDEDKKPDEEDDEKNDNTITIKDNADSQDNVSHPPSEIIDDDIADIDFTKVIIKKEKETIIDLADSSTPSYITTIDGNIIHEKPAAVVAPGRIKININTATKSSFEGCSPPSSVGSSSNDSVSFADLNDLPDDSTSHCKPGIDKNELVRQKVVKKGKETSGLCIIS